MIAGAITLGTFVAFVAYQMRLLAPVQGLMGIYASLVSDGYRCGGCARSLDTGRSQRGAGARSLRLARVGEITFEGVGFSFGRGAPVLDGFDLRVARESASRSWASGSGKSTIADLLVRQLDPDRGRIHLDGHDLRALRARGRPAARRARWSRSPSSSMRAFGRTCVTAGPAPSST